MPFRLAIVALLLAVGCGSQTGDDGPESAGTGGTAAHGGAGGTHSGAGSGSAGAPKAGASYSDAGDGGAPPELGGAGGVGGVDSVEAGATGEVQAGAAGSGVSTGALFSRCSDASDCADGLVCAPEETPGDGVCSFRCGMFAFPDKYEHPDPNLANVCEQRGGVCGMLFDARMWCYSSSEG